MTPEQALKHFKIEKSFNRNAAGEVTQTLIDIKFPNRCEASHKIDSAAAQALAEGILLCIKSKDKQES